MGNFLVFLKNLTYLCAESIINKFMGEKINRTVQNNPKACACIIGGVMIYGVKATIANVKLKRKLKELDDKFVRCKAKVSIFMDEFINEL